MARILPDSAKDLIRQYSDADEQLDALTKQKQHATNLLKQMLGENEIALLEMILSNG